MGFLSGVNFLLESFRGGNLDGSHYVSALSSKNLSIVQDLVLPLDFSETPHSIAGCCKGLVCLDDEEGRFVIWNPSTGEHKELHVRSSLQSPPGADESFFSCSGFGYDFESQDYKVVRFMEHVFEDEYPRFEAELYSFNSHSWKKIHYPYQADLFHGPSIYINGMFYWLAHDIRDHMFVLSFNFATDQFSSFPLPVDFDVLGTDLLFIELDESLAAIVYSCGGTELSFDIWVMNNESWIKKSTFGPIFDVDRPLGLWKKSKFVFEGSKCELLLYDFATRKLKHLGFENDNLKEMELFPYVENTQSLRNLLGF
ncbi:hypothetical protein PTKIN_Ptkin02bG0257500 [Pterospermum kingtungense]